MAFRTEHGQWGSVFAHLEDLGCGHAWAEVWRARPPAPLSCAECGHPMYAKVSPGGLRHFAHAPGAPHCATAAESLAHHLLKLELSNAARDFGAVAEMEVRGPGGAWRADVLASDPGGAWRMALEAQLSPITPDEISARTERMRADGVASCWFSDLDRPPWLGVVPSVRLARPDDGGGLAVAEGLMRFPDRCWTAAGPVPLAEFLGWAFAGRVLPHARRAPMAYPLRSLAVVWTAPRYVAQETAHLEAEERQRKISAVAQRTRERDREHRQAAIRARNEVSRGRAQEEAAALERSVFVGPDVQERRKRAAQRWEVRQAVAWLAQERGVTAAVGRSIADTRYAGGIPLVDPDGVPVAVIGPSPAMTYGPAVLLLAGLLLLFCSEADRKRFEATMRRARRVPAGGFQTAAVWDGVPPASAAPENQPCWCSSPDLVARIPGRTGTMTLPAVPSDTLGPAASLYRAECRVCGGRYTQPWRRRVG